MPAGQFSEPLSFSVMTRHRKHLEILVIEDDFGDYDAAARALKKMYDYEARCTRAKTLEAARLLISQNSYDVYLIDYHLGTESGARFLKEIGGRSSLAVPILVTGRIEGEVQDNALTAGALSCINKSDLSPSVLESTIRSALYTHQIESEIVELLSQLATSGRDFPSARLLREKFADRMAMPTGVRPVQARVG